MSERRMIEWSQLPPELLSKIAGTLDKIADRVRFGGVCKPWRSTSKSTAAHLPPVRLLWFLLPYETDSEVRTLYSLSNDKLYPLHLPQFRNKRIYVSSYGWFLTVEDSIFLEEQTALLLNPITSAQMSLPPLPFGVNFFRCKLILKPDHAFVAMLAPFTGPILCHRQVRGGGENGDTAAAAAAAGGWTEIRIAGQDGNTQEASDFTYYRGRYFILGLRDSLTSIVDPNTNRRVSLIPSVGTDRAFYLEDKYSFVRRRYLVESSTGERLFLVITPSRTRKHKFEVFELNETEQQTVWSNVKSIGRDTLFIDAHRAMALPASEPRGCRGNCIVFLDYTFKESSSRGWGNVNGGKVTRLALFDIGNDRVQRFPSSLPELFEGWSSQGWFVPSL